VSAQLVQPHDFERRHYGTLAKATRVLGIIAVLASVGYANWSDSFDGGAFNLATWQFPSFPQVTGTFKQTFTLGAEDNYYLALTETTAVSSGGAAFGAGFGSTEIVQGCPRRCGGERGRRRPAQLLRPARPWAATSSNPDGKLTGVAPGFVADCYCWHSWCTGRESILPVVLRLSKASLEHQGSRFCIFFLPHI